MHLRFARGHEYFVGFPVQATCRGCGTLNQASSPTRLTRTYDHQPPEIAETRDVLTWPREGAGRLAARQASNVFRMARDP